MIYLAGDLAAALGRIGRLRASGIEVMVGLNQGIARGAAIVIDAISFDTGAKIENCLDLLRRQGASGDVLVLYRDRSLVVPVGNAQARVHSHPTARRHLAWLQRVLTPEATTPMRIRRSG